MPTASADGSASSDLPAEESQYGLAANTIVRVVVTELVVRSDPEISDASIIAEEGPWIDAQLWLDEGPVHASGYEWFYAYEIRPGTPPPDEPPAAGSGAVRRVDAGWVAVASREGETWVEPMEIDCPPAPYDFFDVASLAGRAEALHCFAGELTVEALGTSCAPELPWGGERLEPEWLANACELSEGDGYMWFFLAPESGLDAHAPPMSSYGFDAPRRFRLTGRFDHPAAETCSVVPETAHEESDGLVPGDDVRLVCRTRFAVTELVDLGPP